jgi:hypothetical protein
MARLPTLPRAGFQPVLARAGPSTGAARMLFLLGLLLAAVVAELFDIG